MLNTQIAIYPPLGEVLTYTSDRKKLWSRRRTDDDFLALRLGSGSYPMLAELSYPERRFDLESDPLEEEMYDIVERKPVLEDVPVLLELQKDRAVGILGDREARMGFVRSMMMRLALLYSCDEVKLVLLADPDDLPGLEFARWLPHCWNDLRTLRYIASDAAEAYQVGEGISSLLQQEEGRSKKQSDSPHFVVFALSKRLLDNMEALRTALQSEKGCNASLFALFDDLPKECATLIRLNDRHSAAVSVNGGSITFLDDIDRPSQRFRLDDYKAAASELSMRALYRLELKALSEASALPKSYTFLGMYGVNRVEHLNILGRWHENNASRSLEVPVGIGKDGEPFMLNLHQKHHGPHGLVAGTTGSGKSEFLLTYILSLAINFHPDEVAFLLIDYKGGGLAGAFDDAARGIHLPHLIGTITNLDGSTIARSLVSIQSEMTRRQVVFQKARSLAGEGTMDIYIYQNLYRQGVVKEPMPHLFIISDEFAELKQQQPDFLSALVSIARIGRSLGVHLILATQKPGGIVTEQIQSNAKFRVCLKVQDRADSMEMLKRPEASELKETGRFYLQVGNNEQFAMGQAAWCGADYELTQGETTQKDKSIQAIDNTGNSLLNLAPPVLRTSSGQSQLVAIMHLISQIAGREGIRPRQLWLPPLPDKLDIDAIPTAEPAGPGEVVYNCGMIDDPSELAQFPMTLNLTAGGNLLLVGEPGSGKTSFIQTMLWKLSDKYSPEQMNYYILDYSSRLLRLFSDLPHCGAALSEDDEGLLDAFFAVIDKLTKERRELFSRLEVGSYEAACEIQPIPLILVVIDNLAGMGNTRKGQKYLEELLGRIKNCGVCGMRFVIGISHLNEATFRIKQELLTRVTLCMKDRYSYGDALNVRVSYVPPEKKGRGLFVHEGRPLEVQMAQIGPNLSDRDRVVELKDRFAALKRRYAGSVEAAHIKTISATETYEDFCREFTAGRIPLGYDLENGRAVALPLKQFSMLTLYFGNPDSVVPVLNNFLYLRKRQDVMFVFMRRLEGSRFEKLRYTDGVNIFDSDPQTVDTIANTLLFHIKQRRDTFLEYCGREGLDPEKESSLNAAGDYLRASLKPLVVVFERMADIVAAKEKVEGLVGRLTSVYVLAKYYNVFLIGCIYPNEQQILGASPLYSSFNPERLAMLFGGNLKEQQILSLPYRMEGQEGIGAFNRCVMGYRGEIHQLMMPCGVLEEEILPEDDRPIFARV